MSEKKVPRCYQCQEIVTFDNNHIGKSGKKIPLDPSTMQPHQCKEKIQEQENKGIDFKKLAEQRETNWKTLAKAVEQAQAKEPANKLPPEMRPTRARFALIEHELQHVAVNMLTEYVNKYRDFGGQTFGVTYHYRKEDGYTVFFVSHDIPNAAVAEMESL
jgi:hypothetical protein